MPVITANNRDVATLANIVQWLQQIKDGNVVNAALPIPHMDGTCTVSFYTDQAMANLVFSDNTTSNPGHFSTSGTTTFYTPPDILMNDASGLSTTLAQPLYYVNAVFGDSTTLALQYQNSQNLLFSSVIVSSDKNPKFTQAGNVCIVVPSMDQTDNSKYNDSWAYVTLTFDLFLQLNVPNWANLSEQTRQNQRMNCNNLIRNTLYMDQYRNGNATLVRPNLNGTYVGSIKPLPSPDSLRGTLRVQTAYIATPSTY